MNIGIAHEMKLLVLLLASAVAVASGNVLLLKPKLPSLPSILPSGEAAGRITNGDLAEPGQFPYQVGLSLAFSNGNGWCGGTLISDRWVITAAHCADGASGATVYLGAWDIQDKKEEHQQRIYSSEKYITVHEHWDPTTLTNDLAVIKLPLAIEFNDYIKTATLPKKATTYPDLEGETVVASGWGKDSDASATVSRYLRYIEVPVLNQRRCNVMFFGLVTDKMICIDTEGYKSTCNGDSGGPLVYRDAGVNYLIGATSFGISLGCERGWPGVFTRITSYLDWIEEQTGVVNK